VLRRLVLVLLLGLLSLSSATAFAQDRSVRVTRNRVYVDGELVWRGRAVISPPAWSERGDALAFTGRDPSGRARLVVVLLSDTVETTSFSWPVPASAEPAVAVTWLGDGRVGAGSSELNPGMVARYSVE
jgi:hypothetical protein